MMMDQGAFLQSTPISEVVIGRIELPFIARVWRYLESLGCKVTYLRDQNRYHILFPTGTAEDVYAGQSTQWTHRTTLRFPGGQMLTKYVVVSLPHVETSLTMLAFPNEVLFGPEPRQI
jgi:hypothetical protein